MPIGIAALLTSGCLGLQAKAPTELPLLETPEAPPRVVQASDPQPQPIVGLPDEPASNPPPRPRPAPPQRAEAPRPAEPPRADAAADAPRVPDEGVRPPLQTTTVQQEGEFERRVRGLLSRATTDLGRVNYQTLNVDGRTQYDTAKRFVSQADEAIKAKNLVFAHNLADKAAALAAELAGR